MVDSSGGDELVKCWRDDVRVVSGQTQDIGQRWQNERPLLRPLPMRPFDCCVTRRVHLTPYSQVVYETNRYSVPVEQARRELVLKAYPFHVEILAQCEVVARHGRCYGHGQDVFDALHYLALLEQRPGAFDYARPLRQWRSSWPESYHRLLRRLRETWPEGRGVKEFVQVLRLHQQYPASQIERAVEQALSYDCVHFDGVKHCLEHLHAPSATLPLLDLSDKPHLAALGSQPIELARYDQLVERGVRA